MIVCNTATELRAHVAGWRAAGLRVAFVPTMGALHAGHLSLVRLALEHADRCVVSIYVNPTQFAPHEDFESYPRDVDGDVAKLEGAGAHLVYTPDEADIYPDGRESIVKAGAAAKGLESDFRPHFFDGVVNVVYRLFERVQPDVAIFGEKDFQQLQVITEMVAAEKLPIEIVGAKTARDEHGLALSSRNAYLSATEIEIARMLNVILKGDGTPEEKTQALLKIGFNKVDYVSTRWGRILAAAWLGKTRLIDNMQV